MTPPRIALIVDHPHRDLAGLALTAFALCQRGAVCHLVPLNMMRELWGLAPDLVLLNFVRRGNDGIARALLEAGVRLAVLDTEGAAWESDEAYSELLWPDGALLGHVRPFCAWGERLADHLVATGRLAPAQIVLTGCPRFDFYAPEWRAVLSEDAAGARRPRLLINTNFSNVNPRFGSRELNFRQCCEDFGWSADRTRRYMATEDAAIDAMIALARRLAGDYPACDVVLRPHPFELPRRYESALGDVPNVIVDPTGPVQPQIFRAAAVIQRSCSTAVEATLAGVPAFSPQWIVPPALVDVAERVSVPCASYEALRDSVGEVLAGRFTIPAPVRGAIDDAIRAHFHAADGRAHARVADAVLAAAPERGGVDVDRCRRGLYGTGARAGHGAGGILRRIARQSRMRLRLSPDFAFSRLRVIPQDWAGRPDKAFDADDVRRITDRIAAVAAVAAARGETVRPVVVGAARDHGGFVVPSFRGLSVTLACEARGGNLARSATSGAATSDGRARLVGASMS